MTGDARDRAHREMVRPKPCQPFAHPIACGGGAGQMGGKCRPPHIPSGCAHRTLLVQHLRLAVGAARCPTHLRQITVVTRRRISVSPQRYHKARGRIIGPTQPCQHRLLRIRRGDAGRQPHAKTDLGDDRIKRHARVSLVGATIGTLGTRVWQNSRDRNKFSESCKSPTCLILNKKIGIVLGLNGSYRFEIVFCE